MQWCRGVHNFMSPVLKYHTPNTIVSNGTSMIHYFCSFSTVTYTPRFEGGFFFDRTQKWIPQIVYEANIAHAPFENIHLAISGSATTVWVHTKLSHCCTTMILSCCLIEASLLFSNPSCRHSCFNECQPGFAASLLKTKSPPVL